MNGMVDSRVVEMHFDNSDFMDKINETIIALERLNDQISSINSTHGLSNLTSGADAGLSNVEKSLGNIERRFSIVGIVGMTIVQRLTNAAINSVQKVSNLLGAAARQAKQGGFIRAENIEQAKFLLEGLGADVEGVFKRVDTAVTGTSYGIDEAARAAASFYASGITNGDKLEHSLRAVAGVAAMTGSDFASIADIFTTVAGQGKVMTMQLRMMEGRGLNAAATMSKFFNGVNDGSIKATDSIKESVKKITNGTKVSEEAVRDFVTKGKIDFEVFSAAMDDAFGEHAQEANKTFSGSLSNLKTSLSRLGEAFMTPGMQAAIPLFNRLRETISNFTNSLKKSKFSREIDDLLSISEKAGKILPETAKGLMALLGGQPDKNYAPKLYQDVSKYINDVLNGSKKANKEIKKEIKELTGGVAVTGGKVQELAENGKISFDLFNAAVGKNIDEVKKLSNASSMVSAYSKSVKELGNSLSASIKKFNESDVISNVAETIYNSFRIIKTISKTVKEAFNEVFSGSAISVLEDFTAKMADNTKKAADWFLSWQNIKPLKNFMVGLFSGMKAGMNIISGLFKVIKSGIGVIFGASKAFNSFSEGFRDSMQRINEKTGTIGIFDKLAKVIEGLGKLADSAFKKLAKGFGTVIDTMAKGLGDVENISKAFVIFGGILAGLSAGKNFKIIKYRMGLLTGGFGRFIQALRLADLQDMGVAIRNILDNTARALKGFTHEIKVKVIKSIALAVLALAVALKILETIDGNKLAAGLGAVTLLIAETTGVLIALLTVLNKTSATETMKGVFAIGSISNALIKVAVAVLLMAVALKMISDLKPEELARGLVGLTVMLGALLGFIIAISKAKVTATSPGVALMFLSVAASLAIISGAVQTLSGLSPVELAKGLGSIVVLMGAIFGFMAAINASGATGGAGLVAAGVGMIAIAAAINILVPALERLGAMSLENIAKGITALFLSLVAMASASMYVSAQGAGGILLMSIAIASLATSLQRIGEMDIGTIAKGLITIAIALGLFVAASIALAPISGVMLAVGGAMLMLSGSVFLLGAGLVLIGTGLTTISAGIMAFSSVAVLAVQVLIDAIKTALILFMEAIPQILEAFFKSLTAIGELIVKYAPAIIDMIGKLMDLLLEVVDNYGPKLIEQGVKFALGVVTGFLKGMGSNIKSIAKAAIDIVSGFIEGIASGIDGVIQAGIDLIVAFINGLANGIRDNTEAIKAAITNLCEAILEAFMSFFGISSPSTVMEQQGGFLMQGLLNGIKSVGGIPAALLGAVKNGLGRLGGYITKFKQKGSEIIKNIGAGIKGKASDIKTKVGDAVTKAKTKVGEYAGKFKDAGKDLISGVAKGVKNGASSLLSAAGTMAQKALNKFKQKLGISSPSKVFAAEARWIPEGVAVGINKTANKVQKAVELMTVSAIDPLSQAISKTYSYLESDGDFNPTITPVLDLSEVRRDAGGIGSIFGTETVSLASSIGQNDIQNIQNNNLMNQLLTKMDKIMNSDKQNPANITNHFTVNGNDDPEQFVNTFVRTLNREMKMRAV